MLPRHHTIPLQKESFCLPKLYHHQTLVPPASSPRHLPSVHMSRSSWSLKQMESHSLSSYDFLTLPAKISSGFVLHTVACTRTALLNNILLLVRAMSSLYVHRHLGGFHLSTIAVTTAAMYLDTQISMSPEFSQNPLLSLFY